MRTSPQSAHRSTWPPSAAVRQASMAPMTRRCPLDRVAACVGAIGGAVAAEDVRHLERGPHESATQPGGVTARLRRSSGLVVPAIRWVATWV